MTIDEIKAKAEMLLKNSRETQGEFVQVYNNGFEDGVNFVLQNLQQTPCSTLRELLVQLLGEAKKRVTECNDYIERAHERRTMYAIQTILSLIDAQKPVA